MNAGVLVELARNPAVAEAPGARFAFHDGAWIIADGPFCMDVPFQACVIVAIGVIIHWTYQSTSGADPVFLIVTSAWKPPCQELVTFTVAVHDVGAIVGEELGDGVGVGVGVAVGVGEGLGDGLGEAMSLRKFTSEQP